MPENSSHPRFCRSELLYIGERICAHFMRGEFRSANKHSHFLSAQCGIDAHDRSDGSALTTGQTKDVLTDRRSGRNPALLQESRFKRDEQSAGRSCVAAFSDRYRCAIPHLSTRAITTRNLSFVPGWEILASRLTTAKLSSLKTSRMEWTDSQAAELARKGNHQAFRVLVERHSRSVFRLAFRMTGNEQDAEDVVQETFLRVFKQLQQFDGRAAFSTWLYRICANCSLDLMRARKARNEQNASASDETTLHWLDRVAAPDPSPERLTQSRQIAAMLEPALKRLSEIERTAFVLRHYEGCDIGQIAEALGVGAGAAKHSVFRAVQKLRRALQPAWEAGAG